MKLLKKCRIPNELTPVLLVFFVGMKIGWRFCLAGLFCNVCLVLSGWAQLPPADSFLHYRQLPTRWDEGLPLGNGMQGVLIWQREGQLRLALDRADLWDERPMKGLHRPEFSYDWVRQQHQQNNYQLVQAYFDHPYDREPAPSKLPGAAIEIDSRGWGSVQHASVNIFDALAEVKWRNGARMQAFVSAVAPFGFFSIQCKGPVPDMTLLPPPYNGQSSGSGGDVVGGDDLSRLGYAQGSVLKGPQFVSYLQPGYQGFQYRVSVVWRQKKSGIIEGAWQIAAGQVVPDAQQHIGQVKAALGAGFAASWQRHKLWWRQYWAKSQLQVPQADVQRAWYLAQYFFGSTSRPGGPPVSLQAIWTADNGRLPPWKGDFHHDLNTQMSYWPAYTANRLEEAMVFPDYLDARKSTFTAYTQRYFGKEGLNVPGVTTLAGTEMGGWIQYSLSPTVSAWLAQHYYWQWRYSMDTAFLRQRAYPWVQSTARFLQQLTIKDSITGLRRFPLSSSPEINDNSAAAWFTDITNYDLSLIRFTWLAAAAMARQLRLPNEAAAWEQLAGELPAYALTSKQELMFASSLPYQVSHRHFSHLMAIYPLGLLRVSNPAHKSIITASLRQLDSVGPSQWTGYSYAWQAALKARAADGEGAARALEIFSTAFCATNGFHLNGDQSGKGYSSFTYRPFTLEGNMAAAAAVQEMLLQSHTDTVQVFPAVPASWRSASFQQLRTEGGLLVSARRTNGATSWVQLQATVDGSYCVAVPGRQFEGQVVAGKASIVHDQSAGYWQIKMRKGAVVVLRQKGVYTKRSGLVP